MKLPLVISIVFFCLANRSMAPFIIGKDTKARDVPSSLSARSSKTDIPRRPAFHQEPCEQSQM